MTPIVWAAILILGGMGLIVLETFIPSHGVLALFAGLSIIAGVVVAFKGGQMVGTVSLVCVAILVPILVGAMLKWWPNTPIGRAILIPDVVRDEDDPQNQYAHLVGRHGVVRKQMMPNGQVVVDNRAYDAVSQGLLIEKGVQVVIITADGNRILVRPVADGETEAAPGSEDISMSDDIGIVVDDSSFEDPFG
ncbi:MAG: NfeD family protein [Planctomycetota bacterium]|nr:NfeD family protein [Planctomycetota bacterium]